MQGRAPKGMRPLGYAVDGEVIPHEAEAVKAIYELFTRIEHPESRCDRSPGLSVAPSRSMGSHHCPSTRTP